MKVSLRGGGAVLVLLMCGLGACSEGLSTETRCSDFNARYDLDSDREFSQAIDDLAEMNDGSISAGEVVTISGNCQNDPSITIGEAMEKGSIFSD